MLNKIAHQEQLPYRVFLNHEPSRQAQHCRQVVLVLVQHLNEALHCLVHVHLVPQHLLALQVPVHLSKVRLLLGMIDKIKNAAQMGDYVASASARAKI